MDLPAGEAHVDPPESRPIAPFWRVVHTIENIFLALTLAGVVLVPITDLVLRAVFKTGLEGAGALTQHFTLLVSMFGGAVAAREARLLAVTHGFSGARAPWGAIFETIRVSVSVGISALLAWAGWRFLLFEKPSGQVMAYDIPLWVPQIALVVGFALVTVRLLIHTAHGHAVRVASALLAAAIVWAVLHIEPGSWTPVTAMLIALVASVVCGAPIFVLLGGAAVFLFWGEGTDLATIALSHYSLTTNPTIPALPLFTLAGYFLAEGGTSHRMFRLLRAVVGTFHAGPALVTVLACAFFTAMTGASGVTILALGGILVPFLREARYTERDSLGFFTCAGSVGMLFAPCLPLILFAIVASQAGALVEIKAMFLGGIGPGLLFVAANVLWGTWRRPRAETNAVAWTFDFKEAATAAWKAKWELLIPVVSLGGIFSGLATPVEASALTALYAFFIETFIYRDLNSAGLMKVMRECGMLIGGVLLMLGVAQAFTNYLVDAQIPTALVALTTAHIKSKYVFLALLNVVLLLVGCVMEVFQAIIVVAPLIVPISREFGINPIHLGILFLANLELGFMMPPVGMNLLLAAFRFKKTMTEVLRSVAWFLWPQLLVVLLVSYWPPLSEYIPKLFGY